MICNHCGHNQPESQSHCAACGQPLAAPPPFSPPQPPAAPAPLSTSATPPQPPMASWQAPPGPPPVWMQTTHGPGGLSRPLAPQPAPPMPGPPKRKNTSWRLAAALVAIALAIALLLTFLVVFTRAYMPARTTLSISDVPSAPATSQPEDRSSPDGSSPGSNSESDGSSEAATPGLAALDPDPDDFLWLTQAPGYQPAVDGEILTGWENIKGDWDFCYIDHFTQYDSLIYMKATVMEYDPELHPGVDAQSNAVVVFQQQYQQYASYGTVEMRNSTAPFTCGAQYNEDGTLTVSFPDGTVDSFVFWQKNTQNVGFSGGSNDLDGDGVVDHQYAMGFARRTLF